MKTGELTTAERDRFWPPLPFQEWQDTAQTLRLWTQIVGKVRLTLSPWINHPAPAENDKSRGCRSGWSHPW
jgi:hypothetical protein